MRQPTTMSQPTIMSPLTNTRLKNLVDPVLQLVVQAGRAVMAVYALGAQGVEHVGMNLKGDDSPVTQADLAAHEILTTKLTALTPDIPVVSEEDPETHRHRQSVGAFWLLDPVDGTREFLARTDEFTVNVALIVDGYPVFGVVQAPALDQLYWGAKALGAWRIDAGGTRRIQVAPFPKKGLDNRFEPELRIIASRSHMNSATRSLIEKLEPRRVVGAGSSLKFCRIAEGLADYYPRLGPTCEWDTAAAQAVVEAAGGQVLTLDRQRLHYGKPDILNPHFQVSSERRTD